jgi:hypothetical protein
MTIKIQLTKGCPNECPYCYEKAPVMDLNFDISRIDPIYPGIIQILDMNFLANPRCLEILKNLPKSHYELVCGVDFRLLTPEICELLKQKGFIKIRWAWDYGFSQQRKHNHILEMLQRAGFKSELLSVFILANWKIPFSECVKKLDLLKIWNVKVNDCCWNGGYKIAKPQYWELDQIVKFRALCRKHNQLIRFKIDPEYK